MPKRRKEAIELLGQENSLKNANRDQVSQWLCGLDESVANTHYYFPWETIRLYLNKETLPIIPFGSGDELEADLWSTVGIQKWLALAEEAVVIHGTDNVHWRSLYAVKLFAEGGMMQGPPLAERLKKVWPSATWYSDDEVVVRSALGTLSLRTQVGDRGHRTWISYEVEISGTKESNRKWEATGGGLYERFHRLLLYKCVLPTENLLPSNKEGDK